MQVMPVAEIDSVLHNLVAVGRIIRQRSTGESMDPGSFWLLKTVAGRGPMRVTELAASANLDPSTVSRHVAQMERAGLIDRATDPADRRAQLVAVSAEGQRQLEEASARRRTLLSTSLAHWEDRDVADFERLLAKFVHSIETTTTTEANI